MQMISRRSVGAIMGASALTVLAGRAGGEKDGDPDKRAGAAWMDAWMNSKGWRRPEGGLYLGRFADPIYFLTKPITWKPNPGQEQYKEVIVPVGFVTDLASIPRIFWTALRPDGQYAYAAIVHDYLYWFQMRPRQESDTILKLGMEDFSIKRSTVAAIFGAVRLAGGAAWAENARFRKAGEKRILRKFPDDPRSTWENWKQRPNVFASALAASEVHAI